jgi:hypothetical protein
MVQGVHCMPTEALIALTVALLVCRIYRGSEHGHGLSFVAEGGPVEAADIHAYAMESIWTEVADMPAKEKEPALPN